MTMVASAQRIRLALSAFDAELAAFGAPWGNDDLGSLIGMVYETIRTSTTGLPRRR
ncbi:hypothetical protein ACQP2C_28225 [Micromonospora zamorensis]|uniref:hypothetical protein n=1 Tax=Micromonospora zamorensis TaxID=709883 RepID=UPI003D9937A5